jgi:N-acetylmuramoyl-L-alanine amidase
MRSLLCLLTGLVLLLPRGAAAAEVQEILLFLGEQHARVLVLLDEEVGAVSTRSMPPVGRGSARATCTFAGTGLAAELVAAYRAVPGGVEIPVANAGIERLVLSTIGADLQLAIESKRSRAITTTVLEDRALLVDLAVPGAEPDASLPDVAALSSWMKGVLGSSGQARPVGSAPRIVVDAGHGGHDPGAVGHSGTHESDIVLSLARKVAAELETRLGAEVILTRDDDTFIPLRDRAAIANAQDADLFLSIHANASPSPVPWGITTFYLDVASDERAAAVAARENRALLSEEERPDEVTDAVLQQLVISGNSALSRQLATEVQQAVIQRATSLYGPERVRDLGVQTALFYVLVGPRMPSILFEASFVSNPEDELRLRTPAFQRMLADSIVDGVARYLAVAGEG